MDLTILQNQRKQIFQHLKTNQLNLFDFDLFDKSFLKYLNQNNLIGQGAVGKVYKIGDLVIKKISPCLAEKDKPLYKYCESLLKDSYTLIPGGNGKYRYVLPNLLTEILIGMVLGEKFPNYFTATLGSLIIKNEDNIDVYIVMEALENFVSNCPETQKCLNIDLSTKDFILMLFQISYSLLQAQAGFRFTHYDLHVENVLLKSETKEMSYNLPNSFLKLKTDMPFLLKISDFALARLETKTNIISSEIDTFPIKSYDEFSPSYDILSFLGSILIDNKYRKAFDPLFSKNTDLYKFMLILTLWIWNDKEIQISDDLVKIRDLIGNKYYTKIGSSTKNKFNFRPVKESDFVKYYNTKSLATIVNFLSRIIVAKDYGTFETTDSAKGYKSYDTVKHFNPILTIREIPEINKSVYRYQDMIIDKGIRARAYHIKTNFPPAIYNFTLSEKQIKECPIQDHYLNTITVSREALDKYSFKLDCCKLDTVNYLLENDKVGFVINGGFFNIKGDFLPIGVYKDNFFEIDKYDVPEEYRDSFGNVVLKNNRLEIRKYISKVNTDEQIFSTGPILIKDGKIVFDPNQMRFICTDEKNSKNIMISQDDETITTKGYFRYNVEENKCKKEFVPSVKTYKRCDKIQPAELSHANNPNPRSALCILSNGDYVFITAEGRGNRGVGFDLYTMSLVIMQKFPDVVDAINLDGGRSSILAWRTSKNPTVYISNADRTYVYPVGNILTLTRN